MMHLYVYKRRESTMLIKQLKAMFEEMVIKKDLSAIPRYYHADFRLYTNGEEMDYEAFLESHRKIYATPIQYKIDYDENTLLEQQDRLAGRIWITIITPHRPAVKIEVMLTVQFKDKKIYRLWELTYPDWSQLPAFIDG